MNITAEDFQAPASVTNAAVCTYNDAPANAPTLSCVLSAVAVAALQADTYLQFRLSLLNATNGDNIPDQVRFWGGDSAFPPVLSVVSGTAGDAFNALPYSLVPNAPNDVPSANSLSSVVTVVQSSSQWNSKTIAAVAVGSIGCTVLAVWAVVRTKRVVAGMSKKRSSKVYAEDEGKYVPPKVQATTRLLAHADSQSADGEGEEENTGSPITSARGPKKSPRAELKAALSKKPHSPPPVPISASVSQASAASSATGQDKPAANPVFQLESVNDPSDSDGKDSDNESDKQAEKAPLNPNFGISKVIAAADSSSGPTGRRASNLPGISTTVGESKTVQVDSGSISDEPMSDADDVDVPVAAQPSPPRSPVPMDSDSDTGGRTMSGGLPEPEPAPRKSATSKPKASSKRNSTGKPRRSTSGRE